VLWGQWRVPRLGPKEGQEYHFKSRRKPNHFGRRFPPSTLTIHHPVPGSGTAQALDLDSFRSLWKFRHFHYYSERLQTLAKQLSLSLDPNHLTSMPLGLNQEVILLLHALVIR
jgi:hypothetical protein